MYEEINTYHTNENDADTDGDGFSDGEEIAGGFDPARSKIQTLHRIRRGIRPLHFSAVFELGTGNTGVVETNFDVTPLVNEMDGVIGYADSSVGIPALE